MNNVQHTQCLILECQYGPKGSEAWAQLETLRRLCLTCTLRIPDDVIQHHIMKFLKQKWQFLQECVIAFLDVKLPQVWRLLPAYYAYLDTLNFSNLFFLTAIDNKILLNNKSYHISLDFTQLEPKTWTVIKQRRPSSKAQTRQWRRQRALAVFTNQWSRRWGLLHPRT